MIRDGLIIQGGDGWNHHPSTSSKCPSVLVTLQLGQMVRTYQTVMKRRGNLPGQVFVDEAGVSFYEFICIM